MNQDYTKGTRQCIFEQSQFRVHIDLLLFWSVQIIYPRSKYKERRCLQRRIVGLIILASLVLKIIQNFYFGSTSNSGSTPAT